MYYINICIIYLYSIYLSASASKCKNILVEKLFFSTIGLWLTVFTKKIFSKNCFLRFDNVVDLNLFDVK